MLNKGTSSFTSNTISLSNCHFSKQISLISSQFMHNIKWKWLQLGIQETTFKICIPGWTRHLGYPKSDFKKWKRETIQFVSNISAYKEPKGFPELHLMVHLQINHNFLPYVRSAFFYRKLYFISRHKRKIYQFSHGWFKKWFISFLFFKWFVVVKRYTYSHKYTYKKIIPEYKIVH